ncbi:MAG: amidophosphoribosyltransferase [Lentisphaeria bacterium]|nr:amidophosphoribosyltransferase [Lentisphaeria bacterium]
MSGFFGVVSQHDCICDLFYGTDYHSHLGTRRGGLAVVNMNGFPVTRIHDISNVPFRSKFDSDLENLHGRSGIGVISDLEDQPLAITSRHGHYALATVGRLDNLNELAAQLLADGETIFSASMSGEFNPTEVVAAIINREPTLLDGLRRVQRDMRGSCSILLLQEDRILAARDRYGRTPVIVGEKAGAYAVTMESTAFPNLDYTVKHELGPGEIVEILPDRVVVKDAPRDKQRFCTFFWVYYGYPSSQYCGISAEAARNRNGASLAEQDDTDCDSVSGLPDSGVAHAIGYSNAARKPYMRAFVKYTPTWSRSFMPQNQSVRRLVARMKLVPVLDQIQGQRLLFCDDSIVRGTQLGETVQWLFERGAKEVHMRSACPPLLFGCRFLNFSRSRSEMDLAARRAIRKLEKGEITAEVIQRYTVADSPEYNAMVEVIREELKLTSLKYQKLEALIEAIGLPADQVYTYCWTGRDVDIQAEK